MLRKTILRNSYWTTVDTVANFLSHLVLSVAVARILGPAQLGYYNYALWVAGMAGALSLFGVPAATAKYASEYLGRGEVGTALGVIRTTLRFQLISAVVVVATALTVVFTAVHSTQRLYSALILLSLIPQTTTIVVARANEAAEDVFANIWPSLIATLVNVAGTLTALALRRGLVGLAAILLLSRCFDGLLRYVSFRRLYARRFGHVAPQPLSPEMQRRMVRFCWQATILWLLNVVVWDRSDIFFVERYCDIRQVAFFSLSFNIVFQSLSLARVFSSAAGVSMMVQQGRDPDSMGPMTATVLRYVALMALPMTLGIAALSSPLLRVLYGTRYLPAIPVLALVALFAAPRALLPPFQRLLVASDNQSFLIRWGLTTGVLNVILDLWWVPGGGAIGAALANGVTQTVATIGIAFFAVRRFSIRLPAASLWKTSASAALMAVAVAGLVFLLPPILGVVAGGLTGCILYAGFLRWTRCLDSTDQERLLSVQTQLPAWLRQRYARGIRLVAPHDRPGYSPNAQGM